MQYLDDLDDIYGAVGLIAEKLRNVALFLALLLLAAIVGAAGIVLALAKPPLACALAILMFVFLLYRAVTQQIATRTPSYGTA
jgi:membrane protein implicated in regulation of membrane protease activity